MSPEVEEMLSKPMNPETMDNEACAKLMSIIVGGFKTPYIYGRLHLLKYYGDMSYKEWMLTPHTRGGSPWFVREYFRIKKDILNDIYGLSGFIPPEDILSAWNAEVNKKLREEMDER